MNALNSALDREYGFWSLFRFALPTIIMMIFMSLYTIVDGIFVCRFVGSSALSAVNIVYPLVSVVIGLGVMLATGGSAVVARKLGEGDEETACRDLTLLVLTGAALGTLFSLLGLAFSAPMSRLLGASDALLSYCTDYLRILLLFAPASILQLLFQSFFVTAGRPGLGLGLTVCSGLTNAVLDYAFIVPLDMGITGAALATAAGYCVTALAGVGFFALRGKGLRFRRPRWESRMLLYACGNGSSEMVTNLSNAVITFLFNQLMLSLLGEDGVAAITIVLYAQFLLTALYMGFSMGVAPVISFNYGAAAAWGSSPSLPPWCSAPPWAWRSWWWRCSPRRGPPCTPSPWTAFTSLHPPSSSPGSICSPPPSSPLSPMGWYPPSSPSPGPSVFCCWPCCCCPACWG